MLSLILHLTQLLWRPFQCTQPRESHHSSLSRNFTADVETRPLRVVDLCEFHFCVVFTYLLNIVKVIISFSLSNSILQIKRPHWSSECYWLQDKWVSILKSESKIPLRNWSCLFMVSITLHHNFLSLHFCTSAQITYLV